jgi:glucose-6-phosphate isomerase
MLYELAGAAGLDEKRANMASGKHINQTEDRAGTMPFSRLASPFYFLLKSSTLP